MKKSKDEEGNSIKIVALDKNGNQQMVNQNTGVFGKVTLKQKLKEAYERYDHLTIEELQDYRYNHSSCNNFRLKILFIRENPIPPNRYYSPYTPKTTIFYSPIMFPLRNSSIKLKYKCQSHCTCSYIEQEFFDG